MYVCLEFVLVILVVLSFVVGVYFLFSSWLGYVGIIGDILLFLFVFVVGVIGVLIGSCIVVGYSWRKFFLLVDGGIEVGICEEWNLGVILINWGVVVGFVGGVVVGIFELI